MGAVFFTPSCPIRTEAMERLYDGDGRSVFGCDVWRVFGVFGLPAVRKKTRKTRRGLPLTDIHANFKPHSFEMDEVSRERNAGGH
jgi:hypothetical protein